MLEAIYSPGSAMDDKTIVEYESWQSRLSQAVADGSKKSLIS